MINSLNLYYIFYQVAISGNITAAARELYISQPAISKAISKLEQSLNTTLFIRNSRGVTLTSEGEILFEQIQNAFQCINAGENQLRLASELGVGHISIGVSTTLCKYVLLPYLKEFVKNNPHIKVSISCMPSIEAIAAMENGILDIGLVRYPQNKTTLNYKHELNSGTLKEVKLLSKSQGRQIGFAYSENKFRENPAIAKFLSFVEKE